MSCVRPLGARSCPYMYCLELLENPYKARPRNPAIVIGERRYDHCRFRFPDHFQTFVIALSTALMSRLASLTPSGTPSRPQTPRSPTSSPAPSSPRTPRAGTPARNVETTHHRMIKLVISEFKSVFKTWDELVLIDGVKAGKGCIDAGTEME